MMLKNVCSAQIKRPPLPCKRGRAVVIKALGSPETSRDGNSASLPNPIINTIPPSREPAPLPKPVPVIHSPVFLKQYAEKAIAEAAGDMPVIAIPQTVKPTTKKQGDAANDSPIDWALRSLDEKLDEVEANPNPVHRAFYSLSRGPVGEATNQGVQMAGRMAVNATVEGLKLAAPVGKWAVQQGFKAAVNLMSAAMEFQEEAKRRKNEASGTTLMKKKPPPKPVSNAKDVQRTGGAKSRSKRPF